MNSNKLHLNLLLNDIKIKFKEFYGDNYYIKIIINKTNNEITFIIYNIRLLDNIRYEKKIKSIEVSNIFPSYKKNTSLEIVYNDLCKVIENKKYNIENNKLIFTSNSIIEDNVEIELTKIEDDNEYIKILSKEIIVKNEEIQKLKQDYQNIKEELSQIKNIISDLNNVIKNQNYDFVNISHKNKNKIDNYKKENLLNDNNNHIENNKSSKNYCPQKISELLNQEPEEESERLFITEEGRIIFRNGLLRGIIHKYAEIDDIVSKIQNLLLKGVKFKLEYKAFDFGDEAKIFHKKCDKLNMSLVLIETDKDLRFGGFTTKSWKGDCIKKIDNNAFVFNIDSNKIYDIIENEPAIGCYPKFGPIFFGCQIRIYDEFFTYGGTTCHKGLNYNTQTDYELNNGEQDYLIKDIEVYSIETIDL